MVELKLCVNCILKWVREGKKEENQGQRGEREDGRDGISGGYFLHNPSLVTVLPLRLGVIVPNEENNGDSQIQRNMLLVIPSL